MADDFNMSMRKYLKQVGVTSQQAIESAMREKGEMGRRYAVRTEVVIEDLDLRHSVEGEIRGADRESSGPAATAGDTEGSGMA